MKHLSCLHSLLRCLAGVLISLTLMDYIQSGTLHIDNVHFHDKQRNVDSVISLPGPIESYDKGDIYHFTFQIPDSTLNRLFPLRLLPLGCVQEVMIGGQRMPLDGFQPYQLCDRDNAIPLGDLEAPIASATPFIVTLKDTDGGFLCVNIIRMPLLNGYMRVVLFALSLYLLTLTRVTSRRQLAPFHYNWCIGGLFVIFSLPPGYMFANTEWFSFLGNGLAIGAAAYLAALWPPAQAFLRWLDGLLQKILAMPPRRFALICTLAFLLLAGMLSQLLYHGIPHIADEHAQYMQSKIFAAGRLYEIGHPLHEFFDFQYTLNEGGKYYSKYIPGHALLLALGQLVGLPWLVNPLLGALTVWVVFLLGCEVGGRATGYIAAALMLVAPMIVFMSAGFMNHVSCMFFLTLFLYAYIRLCKTGKLGYALLVGLAAGCALLIRIPATLPYACPVALHVLWQLARSPRTHWLRTLVMAAAATPFGLFLLYYNYQTTGDAWHPAALNDYTFMIRDFFVHASRWLDLPDDLLRATAQMQDLQHELFGWPTPSLWFVFLLLVLRKLPLYAGLVVACFVAQILGLVFFYRDNGMILTPRYIYESTAILMVLTALGIQRVTGLMAQRLPPYAARAGMCMVMLSLVTLAFPYRINTLYSRYANNFWEGNWGYYQMISQSVEKPALVFFKHYKDYRELYFLEPLHDNDPMIIAQDRGDENKKLMDYYPDRHVYIADQAGLKKLR